MSKFVDDWTEGIKGMKLRKVTSEPNYAYVSREFLARVVRATRKRNKKLAADAFRLLQETQW